MEAGAIGGNSPLTPMEIEQAIRLVPQIDARTRRTEERAETLEHVVVGVPLPDGSRNGGMIERITAVENFTRGLFFTVLAANVMGGVIATALFLLVK